jgi:DNA mismatch endonuclease (patch repair protein)
MVSLATHHVMQANKSKDTKPELKVRRALREAGLPGYRLHWKKAPGKPDICYPGRKVAIFVNGCFWHRCPHCDLPLPKSNVDFWEAKFRRNRERDERDHLLLLQGGWTVVVVWECRLGKDRFEGTMRQVVREVERAGDGSRSGGRLVEAGAPEPWKLVTYHERLRRIRR